MSDYILELTYKHLQGKHDQKTHGRRMPNVSVDGVHPSDRARITKLIKSSIVKANVPHDVKVVYKNVFGRVSSYGGVVGASYQRENNTITIYSGAQKEELPGLIAHEYGHHVFREVKKLGEIKELSDIVTKYNLFSDKPEFSKYASSVWKRNKSQGISEAVCEVYRLQASKLESKVPDGWLEYANAVRRIYDNLS